MVYKVFTGIRPTIFRWDGSEKYTTLTLLFCTTIPSCLDRAIVYYSFDVAHPSSPADPLEVDGHPNLTWLLPRSES